MEAGRWIRHILQLPRWEMRVHETRMVAIQVGRSGQILDICWRWCWQDLLAGLAVLCERKKKVKEDSKVLIWKLEWWSDCELMWEDCGPSGLGKEDLGRVSDMLGGRCSLNMQRELSYRLWAIWRQSLREKSELGCINWELLECKWYLRSWSAKGLSVDREVKRADDWDLGEHQH